LLATGPETVLIIRKACELIRQGIPFEKMAAKLAETARKTHIMFALASYRNLIKAGRVSRLVGFIAGHLGFWGIGIGSDEGEIAIRGKARGDRSMIRFLVEEMKKIGTACGEIRISHCRNEKCASALKEQLEEVFRGVKVTLMETRGLDSFYAERRGLIIGF
jgi:fatty acid-binding protein DegV